MIKERAVEKVCNAVHRKVTLALACNENDTNGHETPSRIKSCDFCDKCGVKTGSGYHWERCVFYGENL